MRNEPRLDYCHETWLPKKDSFSVALDIPTNPEYGDAFDNLGGIKVLMFVQR